MSTDSSTNPSDVAGVSSGVRGEGDGQAAQQGQGQKNPVHATAGQTRRSRRGRRRRGRRGGGDRAGADNRTTAATAQAGHRQPGPTQGVNRQDAGKQVGAKQVGAKPGGVKPGGAKPSGAKPGGHKKSTGPNPASTPAPSTGRPTPNDLARTRETGIDAAHPDPVEAEPVEKLPVDPDRTRPQVTPPKPSDMVAVTAKLTKTGLTQSAGKSAKPRRRSPRADRSNPEKLRTVRETSAGGLVISDLELPIDDLCAALIGRVDRRGRMMWSLPKGHIETGETAEQTAIREVEEETGIQGTVVAPLGKIDYWFVSEGRRIHKTVHHYLLRCVGGELSDEDYEVSEVAWVPLHELPRRLTYSDERRLARMARGVIADLAADPHRLAQSEAESIRTEPNAYEKAAAARNQRRNEPPPPARPRRRRRRPRRPAAGDG